MNAQQKHYFRSGSRIRIVTTDEEGAKFYVESNFRSINRAKRQSRRMQSRGIVLRAVEEFPPAPGLKEVSVEELLARFH